MCSCLCVVCCLSFVVICRSLPIVYCIELSVSLKKCSLFDVVVLCVLRVAYLVWFDMLLCDVVCCVLLSVVYCCVCRSSLFVVCR